MCLVNTIAETSTLGKTNNVAFIKVRPVPVAPVPTSKNSLARGRHMLRKTPFSLAGIQDRVRAESHGCCICNTQGNGKGPLQPV